MDVLYLGNDDISEGLQTRRRDERTMKNEKSSLDMRVFWDERRARYKERGSG